MKKSNTISLISLVAKGCCVVFFVLAPFTATAQTRGTVTVTKDARIDTLLARRVALSRSATGIPTATTENGYRVQFYISSNRAEAYNAQSKFNESYPDYKTYIIYSEPNFKVRAGDFRTKLEATHLLDQLRGQYQTLFIIAEKINLPKTGNDEK